VLVAPPSSGRPGAARLPDRTTQRSVVASIATKGVDRLVLVTAVLLPVSTFAAGVQALFDIDSPAAAPFPGDHLTVPDGSQNTGRRVNLPLPNCATKPSDCNDIIVLNELDGFFPSAATSFPRP
jgi:hypothetical protein